MIDGACGFYAIRIGTSQTEVFRHRCGAQPSKLVAGRKVCGRFDPYASPPFFPLRLRKKRCLRSPRESTEGRDIFRYHGLLHFKIRQRADTAKKIPNLRHVLKLQIAHIF